MTKEEIINVKTFKGEEFPVARRVYETIGAKKELEGHYSSKLLGLLIARLVEREILSEGELDELLFKLVT